MPTSQGHERELEFLVEEAGRRTLVVFVGAGVSMDARLPGWGPLLAPLREELGLHDAADPLDTAQWYAEAKGRPALLRHVHGALEQVSSPGPMHLALARVPSPVVFTTNFDRLMERAIEQVQGIPPDIIIEDAHIGLMDEARRTSLIKLHGCLSVPDSVVVTGDDFEAYAERHRAMIAYLQSLLATRTFLFVGFSLVDPNFRSIYNSIRRALGPYQRKAYLLEGARRPKHLLEHWRQRGVLTLQFDSFGEVREFIDQVATAGSAGNSAYAAAQVLKRPEAPPLVVDPLIERLDSLQQALLEVIAQAREVGLWPHQDDPPAETTEQTADGRTQRWMRAKARALLNLTVAVDQVVPVRDQLLWVTLGDMLYQQGDPAGAIRAYQAVLRPAEDGLSLDQAVLRRVRGSLGRSFALERHYGRAEWLLRYCVFLPGLEVPDSSPDRWSVYRRLDLEQLAGRPTDASEWAYAVSRRAEGLQSGGRLTEAFDALREARYALEPLLGLRKDAKSPPARDLFPGRVAPTPGRRAVPRRVDGPTPRERAYNPRAWALSFLGKCYRLSAEIALELGRADAPWYLERAGCLLHDASIEDALLPYPYAHRLRLLRGSRLSAAQRGKVSSGLAQDLVRLAKHDGGAEILQRLRNEFGEELDELEQGSSGSS